MYTKLQKTKGSLMLLAAAFIWGMAFAAQSVAADKVGSFTFTASRNYLAAVFLFLIIFIRDKKNPTSSHVFPDYRKKSVLAGIGCGVILFFAANLQQIGITAYPTDAAAAGRAGFLTATYVVMVAIVAAMRGKKLSLPIILSTVGCIFGMYLLCVSEGFEHIYMGDIFEILCALCFTVYIIFIDHNAQFDGLIISCVQFFICAILSSVPMLLFEKVVLNDIFSAWLPIVYAGIFSSGIGYTFQILGQKYADPTVASIIMSLESVFAALAGCIILKEQLSIIELLGCALVFASVILTQLPESIFTKKDRS